MDLNNILAAANKSGVFTGAASGFLGGALGGAMMSKKGRKVAGKALQVGGVAAIAGLAYKAYQNAKQPQVAVAQNVPPPAAAAAANWQSIEAAAFEQPLVEAKPSAGLLIIQAMISAANADGHIDPAEKRKIFEQVEQQGLSAGDKGVLFDALSAPLTLNDICAQVNSPALAIEVYTASALAVEPDCLNAKFHLDELAHRLGLPGNIIQSVNDEIALSSERTAA